MDSSKENFSLSPERPYQNLFGVHAVVYIRPFILFQNNQRIAIVIPVLYAFVDLVLNLTFGRSSMRRT